MIALLFNHSPPKTSTISDTALLEVMGPHLMKKFHIFNGTPGSLTYPQVPTISTYPEPDPAHAPQPTS
jgi:hypothetical protein